VGEATENNQEQSSRMTEEFVTNRPEFVVDQGNDLGSADSGDSGGNAEAVESQHKEVNQDE